MAFIRTLIIFRDELPGIILDPNYKDVNKSLTKAKNLNERLESIKRSKAKENKQ